MKTMTMKQLTKKVQAILKANNVTPNCLLVQCNIFTHADGTVNFDFSINADSHFSGRSPEEVLAKLEASYIPKFEADIAL
jgi:hypothetical protein